MALAPGTTVEEAERRLIMMTLAHTGDNKTRAAEILGISLKTLHNKLNTRKLRLRPKDEADRVAWTLPAHAPRHQRQASPRRDDDRRGLVLVLSLMHLARLAQVRLDESRARAELLANAIFQRARAVVGDGADPYQALRSDPGLRSILDASLAYSRNVTFAAIVDADGIALAHADPSAEGQRLPASDGLTALIARSAFSQLRAIYQGQGRNLEFSQPLLLGDTMFGSIRIGISTLLVRSDLDKALRPEVIAALTALGLSIVGAMILAQLLLRPIHVIRSGLTRLGRGEFGVRLDLTQQDEFGELGTFFNRVSAQLSADRNQMADQVANLESAVEHLEDAVAIVSPKGQVLFANPAMRALIPGGIGRRVARRARWSGSSAETSVGSDAGQPPVSRSGIGDAVVSGRRAGRTTAVDPSGQRRERRWSGSC